jgi:hypothetical protein
MCFGNDDAEDANRAAEAERQRVRAEEEARQARIKVGQGKIDTAFAQFNDPYFEKFRTDYVGAQNPDIDMQYTNARGKLAAALQNRGTLSSSIAGNAFGELTRKQNDARTGVANEAFDASNSFRNTVEKTKSNLYNVNTASADPGMIANRAMGEATALVPPKATAPLGDLFGSVLAPFAAYTRAGIYSPTGGGRGFAYAPTSGSGSGSVVG